MNENELVTAANNPRHNRAIRVVQTDDSPLAGGAVLASIALLREKAMNPNQRERICRLERALGRRTSHGGLVKRLNGVLPDGRLAVFGVCRTGSYLYAYELNGAASRFSRPGRDFELLGPQRSLSEQQVNALLGVLFEGMTDGQILAQVSAKRRERELRLQELQERERREID